MTHYDNSPPERYSAYDSPVSIGDWIETLIVLMIPLINIIMLLVWAFSSGTNPSKANFCKAQLLLILIGIALFFMLAFMGILAGSNMNTH